jgi:UDP-N-acetyl-D-glucosamine/UDP-N-acetyl-D-galactosamine dehydrogenase
MNLSDHIIVVVGLGYVGLPLAVEFGRIREVLGFDINAVRVRELRLGRDATLEISHEELNNSRGIKFTTEISNFREDYDNRSAVFIITVPTPVDSANCPDFSPLIAATESVAKVLRTGDVVIYESTVYPGATREICIPVLERLSNLRCACADYDDFTEANKIGTFYVGYSPERINPGDKSRPLRSIRKVTSGSTPLAARAIDDLYAQIIEAGTHLVSTIEVAEAAKIIENAQRDLNIAFVNELSIIFSKMNLNTHEVLDAASTKWNFHRFAPGLVGGHCIGVDPYYLTYRAQQLGYRPEIVLAGRNMNDNMPIYVVQTLMNRMVKNGINIASATVGVLGVSFKENCPDIRNSKVFDLLKELERWGVSVRVVDQHVDPSMVFNEYGLELQSEIKPRSVDSIVIAVAHSAFKEITPADLYGMCRTELVPTVADLKSIYSRVELERQGFDVFQL